MLDRARTLHGDDVRIEWVQADLRDVEIENACAVVMNYTLQFVPSADRLALLTRIREGLDPSGVLIVSEKVRFGDDWCQDYFDHTHAAYKRANGYSALEVAQKRAALEQRARFRIGWKITKRASKLPASAACTRGFAASTGCRTSRCRDDLS